jgi:hypothetical protein
VALLILRAIAHIGSGFSLAGLIVGGIVSVVGAVIASSPEDRRAGWVAIGAGLLTAIASLPGIGGVASWLMMVGGIGLILGGGWSLFKFWRNLRKRGG